MTPVKKRVRVIPRFTTVRTTPAGAPAIVPVAVAATATRVD